MSDINITEARELFERTTQGKWKTVADSYSVPEWYIVAGDGPFGTDQIAGPSEPCSENEDYEWIAYAHNNWQSILDTIERQRAELGEYWRAACEIESVDDAASAKGLADLHEIRMGNSYSQVGPSVAEMLVKQRDELAKEVERLKKLIRHLQGTQAFSTERDDAWREALEYIDSGKKGGA